MSEIILHQYGLSPFSEKIRRILAYKNLPWRAVDQPMMMPKPDLIALTGGYRRIPVLQIGADIYCDTACIARRIEELHPIPACLPPALVGLASVVEDWADHRFFFQCVPPVVVALLPQLPEGFLEDRAQMSPGMSRAALIAAAPQALAQALLSLDRLEQQLRQQSFVVGETFTVADAACFHVVWFLRNAPALFAEVEARPALAAWLARIEGFGPSQTEPLSAAAAIAIATRSTPADCARESGLHAGVCVLGDEVAITADDYGPEATTGRITSITHDRVTIERNDPVLGAIAMHFPRTGYYISKR